MDLIKIKTQGLIFENKFLICSSVDTCDSQLPATLRYRCLKEQLANQTRRTMFSPFSEVVYNVLECALEAATEPLRSGLRKGFGWKAAALPWLLNSQEHSFPRCQCSCTASWESSWESVMRPGCEFQLLYLLGIKAEASYQASVGLSLFNY